MALCSEAIVEAEYERLGWVIVIGVISPGGNGCASLAASGAPRRARSRTTATPSNGRSPDPSRTGAMSSVSSSITPAASAWRTVEAPPAMSTPLSPASLARLSVSGVEPLRDEVEGRPALHLDRLVGVVGEHEHRGVVGRLGTPPAAPVLVPLPADRAEHVAPHDVGAARSLQPATRRLVGARARARRRGASGVARARAVRAGPRGSGPARRRSRRARSTCGR